MSALIASIYGLDFPLTNRDAEGASERPKLMAKNKASFVESFMSRRFAGIKEGEGGAHAN